MRPRADTSEMQHPDFGTFGAFCDVSLQPLPPKCPMLPRDLALTHLSEKPAALKVPLAEHLQGQNHFHSTTEALLALPLSFSRVHRGGFRGHRPCDTTRDRRRKQARVSSARS